MSKATYVIDTNIILRTLIKEDLKSFQACTHFLEKVKTNQVEAILPGIVLTEIVWTLKSFYGLTKKETVRVLESVLALNNLKIVDDYDYHLALNLWKKHKVKYVDCLIATIAIKHDLPVVSYDKDFDKLKVKRIEPEV